MLEWQVQYQLNLRIEMDALKSQVKHERSYREKAEADRDVQKSRVKVIFCAWFVVPAACACHLAAFVLLTLATPLRRCWR